MAGLKVITPPPAEPVSLKELKHQLRMSADDDSMDDTLSPLITAAREWCEDFQNKAYVQQTLELALDEWPDRPVILPRPPFQSIVSFSYTDQGGATEEWSSANYAVDDYSFVARLVKKKGSSRPNVKLAEINAIKIRYIAGCDPVEIEPEGEDPFTDYAANVPKKVKQAIILLAMAWFDTPGSEPPPAVESLLWADRVVPV